MTPRRLILATLISTSALTTTLYAATTGLGSAPDWIKESGQASAQSGFALGPAGDVNGDGFSDVIISARKFDGSAGTDTGRVWVHHGSATGVDPNHAWVFTSDQAFAQAGTSCVTAGDVNGDGYSDVIVGIPEDDGAGVRRGEARIYYGSASGIQDAGVTILSGAGDNDEFGARVATAGDVNGDGYSDVCVTWDLPSDNGRIAVYHGSASGLVTTAAWIDSGAKHFGFSVGTAGDVNADGYGDLVIGIPGKIVNGNADTGKAKVYLGSSNGLEASEVWSHEASQAGQKFGFSVATAGDVNGDGYADIIVGSPLRNNNEGRVQIYAGNATGVGSTYLWLKTGSITEGRFGQSVFTAGDVNGDGYADVVIGAPELNHPQNDGGRVFVYLGSDSGPGNQPDWEYASPSASYEVGRAVAVAGDVNGDGFSDILVGASGHGAQSSGEGAAYIFHGGASAPAGNPGWTFDGTQNNSSFGESVALAGDVNGDGFDDVLVGEPGYDGGQNNEGRARLFEGTADGLSSTPSWSVEGNQTSGAFGRMVATAGDVNGDGFADILVGMPKTTWTDNGNSRARLFYGSLTGPSSVPDWEISGSQGQIGWAVAPLGDVNGDGYADFAVAENGGEVRVFHGSSGGPSTTPSLVVEYGAVGYFNVAMAGDVNRDGYSDMLASGPTVPFPGGSINGGRVDLFLGSATGLSSVPDWTIASTSSVYFAWHQEQIGTAGDVNGDGYSDIIIGSHQDKDGGTTVGRAYVFHGGPSGPGLVADWTAVGSVPTGWFGAAVDTAGDVNGDGFSDVVIGSPEADGEFDREGAAFVYLGSQSGLGSAPVWSHDSDDTLALYGASVSSAGDVNGDGFADIVIGAPDFSANHNEDGQAWLYYGNGGPGISREIRPRRSDDTAPLPWMGASNNSRMRLQGVLHAPFGRGRVGYEIEHKPLGVAYDFLGTTQVSMSNSGTSFNKKTDTSVFGAAHRWRGRPIYDLVTYPYQARGPWTSSARSGWNEASYRTRTCQVGASSSSYGSGRAGTNGVPTLTSTDPLLGETVTISIANGLPGLAYLFYGFVNSPLAFDGGTLQMVPAGILNLPLNAQGELDLPLHLEANPALCGFSVYMQVMFVDPAVSSYYQLAQSNGMAWTLGS